MKKLAVLFVVSILTSSAFAGENPKKLFKEINRKMILDFSDIQLNQRNKDYVMVHFKIVDKEIEITKISGSQNDLKEMIESKLNDMLIRSDYDANKVYKYKFTFEEE